MSITFPYAVKYNGQYYPPNAPIATTAENKRVRATSAEKSKATKRQNASEAAQSDLTSDPSAITFNTEKVQERGRAARQRVRKGKDEVE